MTPWLTAIYPVGLFSNGVGSGVSRCNEPGKSNADKVPGQQEQQQQPEQLKWYYTCASDCPCTSKCFHT